MYFLVFFSIILATFEKFGYSFKIVEKRQDYPQNVEFPPLPEGVDPGPQWSPANKIKPFKKSLLPSNLKAKGAQRLTLWYKTLEMEKQTNQSIVQEGTSYQDIGLETPAFFTQNIQHHIFSLVEFPGNVTVLRVKMNLVDDDDRPLNISSGVYGQASLESAFGQLRLLMGCMKDVYILPWFQNTLAVAGLSEGPEMFSGNDGGDPTTGFWLKKYLDSMLLNVQAVNLDPNRNRTIIAKIDMDFVPGNPRREAFRQWFLPSLCGKPQKMIRDSTGLRKYTSKTEDPQHFRIFGEVVSIQPVMPFGGAEMKVKINDAIVCTSKAEYVPIPRSLQNPKDKQLQKLVKMTPCNISVKIRPGDKFEAESFYDFESIPLYVLIVPVIFNFGENKEADQNIRPERLEESFKSGKFPYDGYTSDAGVYLAFAQLERRSLTPDQIKSLIGQRPLNQNDNSTSDFFNKFPGLWEEFLASMGNPILPPDFKLPGSTTPRGSTRKTNQTTGQLESPKGQGSQRFTVRDGEISEKDWKPSTWDEIEKSPQTQPQAFTLDDFKNMNPAVLQALWNSPDFHPFA